MFDTSPAKYGAQWSTTGAQWSSNGAQMELKWSPVELKWSSNGAQVDPGGRFEWSRGVVLNGAGGSGRVERVVRKARCIIINIIIYIYIYIYIYIIYIYI